MKGGINAQDAREHDDGVRLYERYGVDFLSLS